MKLAVTFALSTIGLVTSAPVLAEKTWDELAEKRRAVCLGGPAKLDEPLELAIGARRLRLEGHRLVELTRDPDTVLRIGVLSAIKDDREETIAAIRKAFDHFAKRKVDVIVANGDLATDEFQMEAIFPILAEPEVPVIATIGNTESCGSFNKIAYEVSKKRPGLINGNWVRVIELDDATLLTLPGYHDRKFTHTSGASVFDQDDMTELDRFAGEAKAPVVLVSHGPPRQSGKKALDVLHDGENVGSELLAAFLKDSKIRFGIYGHILEAGGRGTDLGGKKVVKPKQWKDQLLVNAGTINPDPWRMLDGRDGAGMVLVVEISGKKARYDVLRFPPPR